MWTRVALLIALLCTPAWAKPKVGDLCREARVLVEQHKIKPAVDKYFEALKLDPRCAEAHAGLGELYYHASTGEGKPKLDEMTKTTLQALGRAIELNPEDDKSLFYRGDLLADLGKLEQGLSDLSRSIALKPSSNAYISRAVCYAKLKQDEKAISDYTSAYRKTKDASCLLGRGNCHYRLGNLEDALDDYELVVKEGKQPELVAMAKKHVTEMRGLIGVPPVPKSSSSKAFEIFLKARELKNTGHPKESIPLFDQALAIDPHFAKAAIFKGDAYFMLDDLEHAIECYRRGSQIDPKDKQGHRFLGDALEKKYGRTKQRKLLEEAIRCYETALRIDPSYGYAKESLMAAKARLKKAP